jgi:hypothetical protein
MKRNVLILRQVLLDAERGGAVYANQDDPLLYHHAKLLGDLPGHATVHFDHAPDRSVVFVTNLTRLGQDLLDDLRDEVRLIRALDALEAKGMDRDNLELLRAAMRGKLP